MNKWLAFVLVVVIFMTIHEGAHALIATIYGEYVAFQGSIFPQVIFRTPVEERSGMGWLFISGTSNLVTLSLGYLLLVFSHWIAPSKRVFLRAGFYYLTLIALLVDAFNLSVGPFIYGGDANGIAVGLGVDRYLIQAVFFVILLLNRELVARKLLPEYGVQTEHPLLRRWKMFEHLSTRSI